MGRPVDWHPLAAADPVPGDPYEVRRTAADLRQVALLVEQQAAALRRMSGADWRGHSAQEFDSTAAELSDRLGQARERYAATAAALQEYAPALELAQDASLRAL
ncbi:putative T7SS-secreted protein, partial [Kineococcus glutinatus]|uniref:putative T7SS-secreted protein n=1 Tax=Kineococcus glutinatus TaxID=1070872 RepID=UPI0031ED50DF